MLSNHRKRIFSHFYGDYKVCELHIRSERCGNVHRPQTCGTSMNATQASKIRLIVGIVKYIAAKSNFIVDFLRRQPWNIRRHMQTRARKHRTPRL